MKFSCDISDWSPLEMKGMFDGCSIDDYKKPICCINVTVTALVSSSDAPTFMHNTEKYEKRGISFTSFAIK
jgi:hypothetical protein